MQLNVSITNLNKSQGVVLIIIESLIRSWELFACLQWAFFLSLLFTWQKIACTVPFQN